MSPAHLTPGQREEVRELIAEALAANAPPHRTISCIDAGLISAGYEPAPMLTTEEYVAPESTPPPDGGARHDV